MEIIGEVGVIPTGDTPTLLVMVVAGNGVTTVYMEDTAVATVVMAVATADMAEDMVDLEVTVDTVVGTARWAMEV